MTMAARSLENSGISTDRQWHARCIDTTVDAISQAIEAGVTTVQIRWKNVDSGYMLSLVEAAAEVVSPRADVIINDRIDVFLAARHRGLAVNGVHIGQTDLDPVVVRALIGADAQLGWSVSAPHELARANELSEYVTSAGVGGLHDTSTKTDAPPALGG